MSDQMDQGARDRQLAAQVRALLDEVMTDLVSNGPRGRTDVPGPSDPEVVGWLDDLLSRQDTYRDAALAIMAFPTAAGTPLDTTHRLPSDRAVTGHLERLLDGLNIRCRRDALQTIAKGSESLVGRARASWNELLTWASQQTTTAEIERAFMYLARGIAATARTLPPLPTVDVGQLTFGRVIGLFDALLAMPSGGAHEQFIFAALLDAVIEEAGGGHIATKTLSAADASSGTAGDVQIMQGGVTLEAYEVTANEWQTKVPHALEVLRHYDLKRVHIVAKNAAPTESEMAAAIPDSADISVLDVANEIRSLVHRLQRPGRRTALIRLYEHLVQRQPRDDLVANFVNELTTRGLAAS